MNMTTSLIQSKYFTPVFNTAIFDGPVRLYFSQNQEPEALELYMRLKEFFARLPLGRVGSFGADELDELKSRIFVLLYPNDQVFFQATDCSDPSFVEKLGDHHVIGVRGPFRDENCKEITERIESILLEWNSPTV